MKDLPSLLQRPSHRDLRTITTHQNIDHRVNQATEHTRTGPQLLRTEPDTSSQDPPDDVAAAEAGESRSVDFIQHTHQYYILDVQNMRGRLYY